MRVLLEWQIYRYRRGCMCLAIGSQDLQQLIWPLAVLCWMLTMATKCAHIPASATISRLELIANDFHQAVNCFELEASVF